MNKTTRYMKTKSNMLQKWMRGTMLMAALLLTGSVMAQSQQGVIIHGDVYGGGALASVGTSEINANDSTAHKVNLGGGSVRMVFGGGMGDASNEALVNGNTQVNITGGTLVGSQINTTGTGVNGAVFGGCNVNGTVMGNTKVYISSAVGTSSSHANVYGGGLGSHTNVQGSAVVEVGTGATIYGDVYGGSAKGLVNHVHNTSDPTTGGNIHTIVVSAGTVNGDIYGGGHGLDNVSANVGREITVTVNGGSVNNVFGCNNANGTPQASVQVNIVDGTVSEYVFGGGNLASAQGSPEVNINGGSIAKSVFGGGNEAGVGGATVNINAGTIGASELNNTYGIYGGCNTDGTVTGDIVVNILGGTLGTSTKSLKGIFGGGYGDATRTNGNVTVNFGRLGTDAKAPTVYGDIYGGSALGQVNDAAADKTTVNILNGYVNEATVSSVKYGGNVYGGGLGEAGASNVSKGQVNGEVKVNIGATDGATPPTYTGNATIIGNVFGCNNANGTPKANVTVNVYQTGHNSSNQYPTDVDEYSELVTLVADYEENSYPDKFALNSVYGGGNMAAYNPTTNATPYKATVHVYQCVSNTIQTVYGGGNAADATDVNVIIDGGFVDRVFGGGNGKSTATFTNPGANISGSATTQIHGGLFRQIFGGSNSKGDVNNVDLAIDNSTGCTELINELFGGANEAEIEGHVTTTLACSELVIGTFYGGSNQADIINGSVTLNVYGGTYSNVFGGSKGKTDKPANILGDVTLNLYGGTIDTAFGGCNINGNITGKITVNVLDLNYSSCGLDVHNIYGGGRKAAYTPTYNVGEGETRISPVVNLIHGTVSEKTTGDGSGNVFGGAFGSTATVTSNPQVNIGYDESTMGPRGTNTSLLYKLINNTEKPSDAYVFNVADGDLTAHVAGNVYGGGDLGKVAGSTEVNIQHANSSASSLFGGGNQASVGNATVNVLGGNVTTGVYGGCNTSGTVGGDINAYTFTYNTTTKVSSHTENTSATSYDGTIAVNIKSDLGSSSNALTEGIYGGGKGQATQTTGTVTVTVGEGSNPTIYSDIYGGSAFGQVSAENKLTKVDFQKGILNGTIYGGGKGQLAATTPVVLSEYTAVVNGNVQIDVADGGVTNGIYGGCNVKGNVVGNITVNVNGGTIGTDATNRADVFGGGYGQSTKTAGNVEVTIGNGNGTPTIYGDVYGGSALGSINSATDEVNSTAHTYVIMKKGSVTGNLYGGGLGDADNAAKVCSPVTVKVHGGTLNTHTNGTLGGKVFGCNNINGAPQSTVNVIIEDTTTSPRTMTIPYVFGGGNLAAYTGNPVVNINNGTVTGNVYGGGKGILASGNNRGVKGKVTGNPQVTIGDDNGSHTAHVTGDVYGGGDAADVAGTPVVVVNDCNTTIGYLYGGGNAADVTGTNITVNAVGGITQAYGGGHGDKSVTVEPLKYADVNGDVTFNVYGGTIGKVFAGSNSKGSITGTSALTINKTGTCAMKLGEVYGGGNEAAGNAGEITIGCTGTLVSGDAGHVAHPENIGTTLEGIGTVYGGANQADIGTSSSASNIEVNITSGIVENVFGGNNTSGVIHGTITVNINKDETATCKDDWYVGNVYGGGNLAQYSAPSTSQNYPVVNIQNGTVSGDVFGGGLGSTGDAGKVTGNPQVTINGNSAQVDSGVYGGGSLAPTNGNAVVSITKGQVVNVYGGGKAANVTGNPTVAINGGTVTTGIYGGCNTSGTVTGDIIVNINGGTLGSQGSSMSGGIYGGGFGQSTNTTGDVTVTIGDNTHTPAVYADIYGGSALGQVGANGKTAKVNLIAGTVNGTIYGGGMGDANNAAEVTGNTWVIVNGSVTNGVYGGCNVNGVVGGNTKVEAVSGTIGHATDYGAIYGGGLGANTTVVGKVEVEVKGSTVTGDVYGGSAQGLVNYSNDATPVANSDTTVVTLSSGSVSGDIYGGGHGLNSAPANVGGPVTVTVSGGSVANVFGCNNAAGAPQSTVQVDIVKGTGDMTISTSVYGGGNQAAYTYSGSGNSPAVNIKNGTVGGDVFGGGLGATAKVKSNPKVTVGDATTGYSAIVGGSVYGGGSAAMVGDDASTNNTDVLIQDNAQVIKAFGGGKAAGVTGTTTVEMTAGTITTGLYGGCDASGTVTGDITVNIKGGTIGSADAMRGLVPATANIFGGGYGNATSTSGDVTVNFGELAYNNLGNEVHNATPVIYGDIYGGSALGNVNDAAADKTTVNILNGEVKRRSTGSGDNTIYYGGNIYGGGLGQIASGGNPAYAAEVNGKVYVNVGSYTSVSRTGGLDDSLACKGQASLKDCSVYGCNNVNGTPKDEVYVNIYGTYHTADDEVSNVVTTGSELSMYYAIANVLGGGNKADYLPNPANNNNNYFNENTFKNSKRTHVRIYGCNNTIQYVYGGGDAAAAFGVETIVEGGRFNEIFAGGNGLVTPADIGDGGMIVGKLGGSVNVFYEGSNRQGSYDINKYYDKPRNEVPNASRCGKFSVDSYFFGDNMAVRLGDLVKSIECDEKVGDFNYKYVYAGSRYAVIYGDVKLTVKGGKIQNLYGGSMGYSNVSADIRVIPSDFNTNYSSYLADATSKHHDLAVYVQNHTTDYPNHTIPNDMLGKGGNIILTIEGGEIGNVYGGCRTKGTVEGTIQVIVNDAGSACPLTINNIYGGGDQAKCETTVSGHSPIVNLKNGTVSKKNGEGGNVFGGGRGDLNDASQEAGMVNTNPKVIIGDNDANHKVVVEGNVYGGGDAARVDGSTTVVYNDNNNNSSVANIFGGGNRANVKGSATDSIINGHVTGDVYGGGALAHVNVTTSGNTASHTANANTVVSMSGGSVRAIYGGGMGTNGGSGKPAYVYGNVQVNVTGGTISGTTISGSVKGGVFGGCNTRGTIMGNSTVGINSAVGANVYGGGHGGNTVVQGTVAVNVNANVTGDVYGGSAKGWVNYNFNGDQAPTTPNNNATTVTLTNGAVSGDVYGGGHGLDDSAAYVGGPVTVTVNGGSAANVFGCNNLLGAPQKTVIVNIDRSTANNAPALSVGNVYGGGNLAPYESPISSGTTHTDYPQVNIKNGTVTGNVYGGGNGDANDNTKGQVTGNPVVNVQGTSTTVKGAVNQDVFGGGNNATVEGSPVVTVKGNGTVTRDVFGGGNNAAVTGNTTVKLQDNAHVGREVFGGGNNGQVNGSSEVKIQNEN